MRSKYKALGIVLVATALSVLSTQPAFADGVASSTDSPRGAHVVYTTVNHHFTVYDDKYDGWGAYGHEAYEVGGAGACINEQGFNTSTTCLLTPGYKISYYACLEHNAGATTAYCGATVKDNS